MTDSVEVQPQGGTMCARVEGAQISKARAFYVVLDWSVFLIKHLERTITLTEIQYIRAPEQLWSMNA